MGARRKPRSSSICVTFDDEPTEPVGISIRNKGLSAASPRLYSLAGDPTHLAAIAAVAARARNHSESEFVAEKPSISPLAKSPFPAKVEADASAEPSMSKIVSKARAVSGRVRTSSESDCTKPPKAQRFKEDVANDRPLKPMDKVIFRKIGQRNTMFDGGESIRDVVDIDTVFSQSLVKR